MAETKKRLQAGRKLAAKIIKDHFDRNADKITPITGGLTNIVFEAILANNHYIVRIAKTKSKFYDFLKEQWAVKCVKKSRIPVADIIKVGRDEKGTPYMLQEKVSGIEGPLYAHPLEIIEQMGKLTARINSICTTGFGNGFNWKSNKNHQKSDWKTYLMDELRIKEKIAILKNNKIVTPGNLKKLTATVNKVLEWKKEPALNHGDMRIKNVIVNTKGKIVAVLDWENCTSNMAPYWDLSIALHDLNIDEKEAFVKGYGLSPGEYLKIHDVIKMFNAIHYAHVIEELGMKKDKQALEQYRLRLNGYYDLF